MDPYHPIVKLVLGFKCFMHDEKERFFRLSEDCFKTSNNNPLRVGALAMLTCLYGEWEKGKVLLDRIIGGNLEFQNGSMSQPVFTIIESLTMKKH